MNDEQKPNEANGSASDADQPVRFRPQQPREPATEQAALSDIYYGEGSVGDDASDVELYAGLTSLGFFQAALRRSVALWCSLAVIGLLIGGALYVALPPKYEATSELYLTQQPGAPIGWIVDDQTIAQSNTIAAMSIRALRLHESPADLVKAYTVLPVGNRVLLITVKAPSSTAAIAEANAIASAFLKYQARLLLTQEHLVDISLQNQLSQAEHQLAVLGAQITAQSGKRLSPSASAALARLETQHSQAVGALTNLKQTVNAAQSNAHTATTDTIKGSVILSQGALVKQSVKKRIALFAGGGLLGGLLIGVGFVVLRALLSGRLRRRDEVARALGAPVLLSVGKIRMSPWWPGRRGLAAVGDASAQRLIRHLQNVATSGPGQTRLAVVPVGDPSTAALCAAAAATSCAERGLKVVLSDLCAGAPAARLVGAPRAAGVQKVTVNEAARLVVAIPEDDYVPAGPFGAHAAHAGDELAAACRPADVVLTLAVLDPALGGDYLAGWADDAVVVVTAGRSSAAAVHAAGEMLRLAGLTGISAVLVAADKSDESLGSSHSLAPARSAPRAPAAESLSGQVPPEFAGHSALDRSAR